MACQWPIFSLPITSGHVYPDAVGLFTKRNFTWRTHPWNEDLRPGSVKWEFAEEIRLPAAGDTRVC